MKNITLSAPEALIEQARKKAIAKGTTLNNEFRLWLEAQTANGEERAAQYRQVMKRLSHVNAGRKFTREEMNQH
jgi:hypothetical protein